jgi:hypothetical protein
MKRRYVVIALAVVATLAIVSPGFGISLKKLVKKEVSKQIAKATGPPGVNGAATVNYRRVIKTNVINSTTAYLNARCKSGERLIGGGAGWAQPAGGDYVAAGGVAASGPGVETDTNTAEPVADGAQPNVWHADSINTSGSLKDFVVYAVCAAP